MKSGVLLERPNILEVWKATTTDLQTAESDSPEENDIPPQILLSTSSTRKHIFFKGGM